MSNTASNISVIDSHVHFWDIARFTYRWMPPGPNVLRKNYLPEHLRPELDAMGVRGVVLVEAHSSLEENRFLLDLADANDFIFGVVCWVNLTDPNVDRELDRLRRHPKVVSIRHQVESEPDDAWLIREDVLRGLRVLAEHGLPFDLVLFPRHLQFVPMVAEKVPSLRMVLDHLGKPPIAAGEMEPWASDIRKLAAIPNLYCKISGMVTESNHTQWSVDQLVPYVSHVVEQFGVSRLMWGSDWPVCMKAAVYGQVFDSTLQAMGPLTEPQKRGFLSANAMTFYGLRCPPAD